MIDKGIAVVLVCLINDLVAVPFDLINWILFVPLEKNGHFAVKRGATIIHFVV